jgi:hypothetical protein
MKVGDVVNITEEAWTKYLKRMQYPSTKPHPGRQPIAKITAQGRFILAQPYYAWDASDLVSVPEKRRK